jgi:hypothetical protein
MAGVGTARALQPHKDAEENYLDDMADGAGGGRHLQAAAGPCFVAQSIACVQERSLSHCWLVYRCVLAWRQCWLRSDQQVLCSAGDIPSS